VNSLHNPLPIGPDDSLHPNPGRVDRALTLIYEQVVQEAAKRAAQQRCNHWDLINSVGQPISFISYSHRERTNPEVIAAGAPHFMAIADKIRK
jgi:hypothetical protein